MKYFTYLPKVDYSDNEMTNIMVRGRIIHLVNEHSTMFYNYTIQDSDRPDIVSEYFYGSADYTWVLFYSNDITNPIHDWPLFYDEFRSYLADKYGDGKILVHNSTSIGFDITEQCLYTKNQNEIASLSKVKKGQYIEIDSTLSGKNNGIYSVLSVIKSDSDIKIYLQPEASIDVTFYDKLVNQTPNEGGGFVTISYESPERVVKFLRYSNDLIIDKNTYLNLPANMKKVDSVFKWEEDLNESKRFIRILENKHLSEVINDIKKLF